MEKGGRTWVLCVCVCVSPRGVLFIFFSLSCCFGNAGTAENNWSSSVWNWGMELQCGRWVYTCVCVRVYVIVYLCVCGHSWDVKMQFSVRANQKQLPGIVNRLEWHLTNKETPPVESTCSVLGVSNRHLRRGRVIRRHCCGPLSEAFCRSESIISPVTFRLLDVHLQKAHKLQMGVTFTFIACKELSNNSEITWRKGSRLN